MRLSHPGLWQAHFVFCGPMSRAPSRDYGDSVVRASGLSRLGRPPALGVPRWLRDLRAWGGSRRKRIRVVQLELPLNCTVPIKLTPQFPDPIRQGCFQVRHD